MYPSLHPLAATAAGTPAHILPAGGGGIYGTVQIGAPGAGLHSTAGLPPLDGWGAPAQMHGTLRLAPPAGGAGLGQTLVYGPAGGAGPGYGLTPGLGPLPTPLMGPAADPGGFRIVPGTPAFAPQYGLPVQQY